MRCHLKTVFADPAYLFYPLLRPLALILLLLVAQVGLNPALAQASEPQAAAQYWLWAFFGRFHPMIVHFPIGLLFIALFMELVGVWRKSAVLAPAIKLLVITGAVFSAIAALSGLLLSGSGDYGSGVFSAHQWAGIITMTLACITAFIWKRSSQLLRRTMLMITVTGVTVAGHFGASLTHGEGYLTEMLPGSKTGLLTENNYNLPAAGTGPLTTAQVQELNLQVRTILAHNCYNCHGPAKVKGELRLDSKEAVFAGGEHGAILVPGSPQKSEMMRRILLPRGHKEAMPNKGKGLTKEEIAVLEYWIRQGAPWPEGEQKSIYTVAPLELKMPEIPAPSGDLINPIDRIVNGYFQKNKIDWGKPAADRIYIRRVYLDIIGLLPPPDSVDRFTADASPDKREKLVSNLLNRNDDYAQHWLTFWNDALRNDYTGTGYITGGRFDITAWLYNSLRENKPYNVFVKELISPEQDAKGFISGIRWRGVVNASQRVEMQAAQNVSQVFLGLNLKCASCHDSFISDWKLEDSYAFANIFSDSLLEINRCDKPTGKKAGRRVLFRQLGELDSTLGTKKRLRQLADLLVQPADGRLYRTLVNRIWAQLMGRGVIEPVDVMDNKPWSQELLDWMAADFIESGYDIKRLVYTIVTSKTYQLPSVSVKEVEMITDPDYVFRGMMRRRLTAEEFTDAVSVVVGPVYNDSNIVYKLLPKDLKGKISFARASVVSNDRFLTALGRPNRETVSTSRPSQASLLQALELTNGSRLNNAVRAGAVNWKQKFPEPATMINEIYRTALGRAPAEPEKAAALKMLGTQATTASIEDLIWAITLHPEFQLIF